MRVSELSTQAGTSVATIKFYIREGLLPKGQASAPTQALYNEDHVTRLRLISTLTDLCGLSLSQVREVLDVLDGPAPREQKRAAVVFALSRPLSPSAKSSPRQVGDFLNSIGLEPRAHPLAVAQLQRALQAIEDAGAPLPSRLAAQIVSSMTAIVDEELTHYSSTDERESAAAVALYEPVIIAIRRLALLQRLP